MVVFQCGRLTEKTFIPQILYKITFQHPPPPTQEIKTDGSTDNYKILDQIPPQQLRQVSLAPMEPPASPVDSSPCRLRSKLRETLFCLAQEVPIANMLVRLSDRQENCMHQESRA